MNRRNPFNRALIRSNIAEAIEQLQKIEVQASNGTLSEEALQVQLLHAYHHLNFAWNVRRVSSSTYVRIIEDQFQQWGMYPKDIEEL